MSARAGVQPGGKRLMATGSTESSTRRPVPGRSDGRELVPVTRKSSAVDRASASRRLAGWLLRPLTRALEVQGGYVDGLHVANPTRPGEAGNRELGQER